MTMVLEPTSDVNGAESMIWGSDVPGSYKNAADRQMIRLFEEDQVFSEADKDMIFYANAEKVYFGVCR